MNIAHREQVSVFKWRQTQCTLQNVNSFHVESRLAYNSIGLLWFYCSKFDGWPKCVFHFQVELNIELDDLHEFNESLVEAILQNTRRYSNLFSEVVLELLPQYKERTVVAKDSLDVYIEHRLLMDSRSRPNNEIRDARNKFPPELMKRL